MNMIKRKGVKMDRALTLIVEIRNTYKILVAKPGNLLGRSRLR
jgi:hypothetical protein